MKTSLVSLAADIASAALSKSARVKADQPQQLKSVTVYWRGRKMVLMQRPQRRLPALLCRMLRRSWHLISNGLIGRLGGTMRRAVGMGVMASLVLASFAAEAALPGATLPVNSQTQAGALGSVTSGAASISTVGNQMTVVQSTDKAIIEWQSFSIGKDAGVNFLQNNANSVALNRVIGNDPSVIMGSLTANGKIFLINAAGILVGKTGKIDVAGFTASTLNMSNDDFLAGKMNFAADPGKTIGNVKNKGAITSADGGSVYLIGANVENDGIITGPNGQVLLAAGSMVKLVDTSLPGVSIEVSGVDGKVTNLGQIIASAGTIGIGAALIDNSGIINASSVEREGGRIFLRATKQLTTDATSQINADGTTGGNVQLYSDQVANIDGDVSALGSAGNGGYVDTSGKTVLSVRYVPRVGPGGEWFIDPHNVEIVGDSDTEGGTNPTTGASAITASGDDAKIFASTIGATLSGGTNVTISTGSGGSQAGDITMVTGATITKGGTGAATLTMNAAGNIAIQSGAGITDGSDVGANGGLMLVLNAGFDGSTSSTGTITNDGGIVVGSGLLTHSASFENGSMLFLGGATASISSDLHNNLNGTIAGTGIINLTGDTHTLTNDGNVKIGTDSTIGTLTVDGNYTQTSGGTLEVKLDRTGSAGPIKSDRLDVTGNVTLAGTLQVDPTTNYSNNPAGTAADKVAFLNYGGTRIAASFFTAFSGLPSTMFLNYIFPISGTGHDISMSYAPAGSKYFSGAAGTLNWSDASNWSDGSVPLTSADVYMDTGAGSTVTSLAIDRAIQSLTIASGGLDIADANLSVAGTTEVDGGALNVSGHTLTTGELGVGGGGTMLISGGSVVAGSTSISGSVTVNGTGSLEFTGDLSGHGSLIIGGSAHATLDNDTSTPLDHVTQSGGIFDVDGNFTVGNLTMSGGQINGAVGKSFTVTDSLAQTGGVIGGTGDSAIDIGSFTQATGDLTVGNINAGTSLALTSTNGAIFQNIDTSVTSDALTAQAANGITLNNINNAIGFFAANNTISGDINFLNGGNQLLVLGSLSNDNGNIVVNNTANGITTSGLFDNCGNDLGTLSAGGSITLASVGDMTIKDSVTGHDISLSTASGTDGNIDIFGALRATGNITIASASAVTESNEGPSGSITGNALNVTAATNIGLSGGGVSNNVSFFTANSSGGSVELNNQGDLILTDITASNGAVTIDTSGNMTVMVNSNITSGSGITLRTHPPIQVQVAFEGGDGNGDLPQQVHADMTISGNLTVSSDSSILLHSAGAITQTSGKISATNGDVTLGAHGNLETGGDGITGNNITLKTHAVASSKGDDDQLVPGFNPAITINGQLNGLSSVTLRSAGLITQNTSTSVNAGITTALLKARAHNGIVLNSSDNKVSSFIARNVDQSESSLATGNIELTTASVPLTLSGNIRNDAVNADDTLSGADAANGNVMIINDGDIFQQDQQNGCVSAASTTALFGTVTFSSTSGNVTLGQIAAANLVVDAKNGFIDQGQSRENFAQLTSNLNITGTMTASANTGITLEALNSCGSVSNSIASFSANNSGSGDITLVNNGNIQLAAVTNAGRNISISTDDGSIQTTGAISGANIVLAANSESFDQPGNIIINSQLNGTGSVTLNGGDTGSITEGSDGSIVTAMLTATATKGITLDSANNMVNGFSAVNTQSSVADADGDIKFINNSNVTALHTLTTHVVHTDHGNVSIENTGAMVTTDLIDGPGTVTLRTHSPLTIGAGGVNASGDVSLTAGNPGANSSFADNLEIDGAVASGGNLAMAAGNHLTLNAVVTAAGIANVSAGGGFTFNTPPPPGTNFFVTQAPVDPTPVVVSNPVSSPVNNPPVVPSSATNTVDQNVASTSNNANNNGDTDVVLPITTTNATQQTANSSTNQTVGGTDGEFGGGDTSKDDKKDTSGKPGKPLPTCT